MDNAKKEEEEREREREEREENQVTTKRRSKTTSCIIDKPSFIEKPIKSAGGKSTEEVNLTDTKGVPENVEDLFLNQNMKNKKGSRLLNKKISQKIDQSLNVTNEQRDLALLSINENSCNLAKYNGEKLILSEENCPYLTNYFYKHQKPKEQLVKNILLFLF